jgi:hypothetical protein
VTEPLAAEAPLLFDLTFFYPSDVLSVDQKAIVEHPLCRLRRIEPDPYRGECPQHFVPFLQPGDVFDSEPVLLEVVFFRELLYGSCFVPFQVQSLCWDVVYDDSESWLNQSGVVA